MTEEEKELTKHALSNNVTNKIAEYWRDDADVRYLLEHITDIIPDAAKYGQETEDILAHIIVAQESLFKHYQNYPIKDLADYLKYLLSTCLYFDTFRKTVNSHKNKYAILDTPSMQDGELGLACYLDLGKACTVYCAGDNTHTMDTLGVYFYPITLDVWFKKYRYMELPAVEYDLYLNYNNNQETSKSNTIIIFSYLTASSFIQGIKRELPNLGNKNRVK